MADSAKGYPQVLCALLLRSEGSEALRCQDMQTSPGSLRLKKVLSI